MKKKLFFVLACMMALTIVLPQKTAFAKGNDSAAWKAAYQAFMEESCKEAAVDKDAGAELYAYALYDIDKDSIPELVLLFDYPAASEMYRIYSFRNGKVVLLKEHVCEGDCLDYLATYPNGNGILRCYARQGYQAVFLWTISGDSITESDPIFVDNDVYDWNFTEIGEIVAGAVTINDYWVDEPQPLLRYEDWAPYQQPKAPAVAGQTQDRSDLNSDSISFFLTVFNDQQAIIPSHIAPQIFNTKPEGEMLFSDFLRFMTKNQGEYLTSDMIRNSIDDFFYEDLNGDGQREAVFSTIIPEGDGTFDRAIAFSIILSRQSDKVYAYGLKYFPITGVDPSGILYSYYEDPLHRGSFYNERVLKLVFDKENSFVVNVPFMNYGGQRGNSQKPTTALTASAPLACGAFHTIGLRSDGTVVAAGSNSAKQSKVSGWTDIVSLSAAGSYTKGQKADYSVGLCSDGTVIATGANNDGQCNVSDWKDIEKVAAGGNHTVGLKSDGTVVAVGSNDVGQCDVSSWTNIVDIAACDDHTVGVKADGTVVAVGSNKHGQCDVKGWKDIVAVAAGHGYCSFTVGLKSDGRVVATGNNKFGACDVNDWRNIVAIAAGGDHAVGLKEDGTVVATGWNDEYQCNVSKWTDIVAVAAGAAHTVGLKADGTVVATGLNSAKQCNVEAWRDIAASSSVSAQSTGFPRPNSQTEKYEADSTWSFDEKSGILRINDQSAMKDYSIESSFGAPWSGMAGRVDTLVISSGVTKVGDWAFFSLVSMDPGKGIKTVYIPKTVSVLGEGAFEFFFDLKDVYYEGNEADWTRLTANQTSAFLSAAVIHYQTNDSQFNIK